jgi:lysophospholipase L1-like esterase
MVRRLSFATCVLISGSMVSPIAHAAVWGDQNGDDQFNVLDILYSVQVFLGQIATPPVVECDDSLTYDQGYLDGLADGLCGPDLFDDENICETWDINADGTLGVTWTNALGVNVNNHIPANYPPYQPQRAIFLGDSITSGVGATTGTASYVSLMIDNDGLLWPDSEAMDLETLYPSITQIIDVSQGGATTASLVSQQLPSLSGLLGETVSGPTLVIMTIGGNDMQGAIPNIVAGGSMAAKATLGELSWNLEAIMDYFQDSARFPDGAFVYLANVYDPTDGDGYAEGCFQNMNLAGIWDYFENANHTMRTIAEDNNIALVDIYDHFLGYGYTASNSWFSDCIHPNDEGHDQLRRVFMAAIASHPSN